MHKIHPLCSSQVLQMYLPFCGISISNAKLFSESRKEYERSRVRQCRRCLHLTCHTIIRYMSVCHVAGVTSIPFAMQALLEVVNDLFEEQTDLEKIVRKIMQRALTLLRCERCSVLLLEDIDSPVGCFFLRIDLYYGILKVSHTNIFNLSTCRL